MSDKTEALMGADEVEEALELCLSGNTSSRVLLRRQFVALWTRLRDVTAENVAIASRLQRAEADNAALTKQIDAAGHLLGSGDLRALEIHLTGMALAKRPGTALLERHAREVDAAWNSAVEAGETVARDDAAKWERSAEARFEDDQERHCDTARAEAAEGIAAHIRALKRPTP